MTVPDPNHEILRAEYQFEAPAETIRQYIQTPERIMDYFPLARTYHSLAPDAFIIRAWSGATLLETRELTDDGLTLAMDVTSALLFFPPFSAEKIRRKAFFSMTEIWQLEPLEQGCRLKKRWGNVVQPRLRFIPMEKAIISSAKGERDALVNGWNMAFHNGL